MPGAVDKDGGGRLPAHRRSVLQHAGGEDQSRDQPGGIGESERDRWEGPVRNSEKGDRWRIPEPVGELHHGAIVVVLIGVVVGGFVPTMIDRHAEARDALEQDDRSDRGIKWLQDGEAATHEM